MPTSPRSAHGRIIADPGQDDARALVGKTVAAGGGCGSSLGMDAKEIYARLEKQFPGKVSDFKGDVSEPYLFVDAQTIIEVCRFLRDDANLRFEFFSRLTRLA